MLRPDRTIGRGVLQLRIEPWRLQAACRDVDPKDAAKIFFPEGGNRSTLHEPYCSICPVRAECLEEGLALQGKEQVGVWGGMTHNQLERERQRRRGTPERIKYPNQKKFIDHGTMEGYLAHRRRHIPLCAECRHVIEEDRRVKREAAISGELGWQARKDEIERRVAQERMRRVRERQSA